MLDDFGQQADKISAYQISRSIVVFNLSAIPWRSGGTAMAPLGISRILWHAKALIFHRFTLGGKRKAIRILGIAPISNH
jgi:hypothetical protein